MKKNILFIIIFSLLINSCSGGDGYTFTDSFVDNIFESLISPERKMTIMVYLDGDNDLEANAIEDLKEMEQGIADAINAGNSDIIENLNIIVLIDRCEDYSSEVTEKGGSDWSDTRLYKIKADNTTYFDSERLDDGRRGEGHITPLGEKNMGAPDTLKWFITYSKKYFPADKYALIFWNHGGGARSVGTPYSQLHKSSLKEVCYDEDNNDDSLYIDEIQQALSSEFDASNKLDLIGFDACLMGTVEVAYEFRNLAKYMVASMNNEQGDGWDYKYIFGNMKSLHRIDSKTEINNHTYSCDESEITGDVLGALIVESYKEYIEGFYNQYIQDSGETQSVVDLSKMEELKIAIDAFASSLSSKTQIVVEAKRDESRHFFAYGTTDAISFPYYDLYDLAKNIQSSLGIGQNVIDKLADTVIYAYGDSFDGDDGYFGDGASVKHGLSIFFTRGDQNYFDESLYAYQWWYTSEDTVQWAKEVLGRSDYNEWSYGCIDFCNSDGDGTVETWRELMEKFYDNDDYTPSSY